MYSDGHMLHWIQAGKIGETPWGWRDAVVVSSAANQFRLRYLVEEVEFDAWHHVDLSEYLQPGSPVRVNQSWGGALQAALGLVSIEHNSPLPKVAPPVHPELWSAQVTPGIVDLATGRGVDVRAPDPELP